MAPGAPGAPAVPAPVPIATAAAVEASAPPAAAPTEAPEPAATMTPTAAPGACTAPAGLTPVPVFSHGDRDRKIVALTFDDGWNADNVAEILRILREGAVNATFFPVGRAIKQLPKTWQSVADAGFPIANHTHHHPKLPGMCFTDQFVELHRGDRIIEGMLGLTPAPFMRPPFGLYDRRTLLAAAAAGQAAVILWDVDARDWSGIGRRAVAAKALGGRNGSIVVMHTSSVATTKSLPAIIEGYRKRGFEFVTVGQLLGFDGPVPFPEGTPSPSATSTTSR